MKKILFYLFFVFFIAQIGSAIEPQTYTLEKIDGTDEREFIIENGVYDQINTIDSTNGIIEYNIYVETNSTNGTTIINMSNGVTIKMFYQKSYQYITVPYISIFMIGEFNNYTIFNYRDNYTNIVDSPINLHAEYNINSGNTTIGYNYLLHKKVFETNKFAGLPTEKLILLSMTTYKAKIKYMNIPDTIKLNENLNTLNPILKFLYDLLNIILPYSVMKVILILLMLLNTLFTIIYILFAIIFKYPLLIIFWIITIGNFYVGFYSNYPKEILYYYQIYYKNVINFFGKVFIEIVNIILRLIDSIRNLI